MKIDPQKVPEDLRPMIPFAEDWGGIEDEGGHFHKANASRREELRDFLVTVEPYLEAIDRWFDSFAADQAPEEAWAFFYLARAHDVVTGILTPPPDPRQIESAELDLEKGREEIDQLITKLEDNKKDML